MSCALNLHDAQRHWIVIDDCTGCSAIDDCNIAVGNILKQHIVVADADEETAKAAAFASPKIKEHTDGKTIRKIIFVPGKLLNIVAS